MSSDEYEKILTALTEASRVLQTNQGELSAADMRIRSLVNITTKEAKRALLETSAPRPASGLESVSAAPDSSAQ
jgi:hypothetical protein